MAGIQLMLSTISNTTAYVSNYTLPPIDFSTANRELEIKAIKEDLNGMHLRIGTFNDGPLSGVDIDREGNTFQRGLVFKILLHLSTKFNFTYDIVTPPTGYWGKDRKRLQLWLVKMLMNHKLDMAAAFISVTPERRNLIKFSVALDTVNCLFLSETKPALRDSTLDSIQPFSTSVWVCFLLSFVSYVTFLTLLTRIRSKLIDDNEEVFTLSMSLSYAYRVCTKQDVQQSPKANATRIMLITWSILMLLVSTYYTGQLSRSYTITSFARIDSVDAKLLLYTAAGISVNHSDSNPLCNDVISLELFTRRPSSFAFPRNSSLDILFDEEIKQLYYYYGLLTEFYSEFKYFRSKVCPASLTSEIHQLSLRDLALAFYCWAIGGIAGLCVFVLELLLNWLRKPSMELVTQISPEKTKEIRSVDDLETADSFQIRPEKANLPFRRTILNGRRYLLAKTKAGEPRLVPLDTLSALLFDLDSYEAQQIVN